MVFAVLLGPTLTEAADDFGVAPLLSLRLHEMHDYLPPNTQLLTDRSAVEGFLQAVEDRPPNWPVIFGDGHHDPDYDERLFQLNRHRDQARAGKEAARRRIAFLWSGELSGYDHDLGGFRVVLGPLFMQTGWGQIRFKYEDLPGNLIAVPDDHQRSTLLDRIQRGKAVEIDVVMTGVLVPEESIIYDFSHEQEGLGLIMPVVRVEHLLYILHSSH